MKLTISRMHKGNYGKVRAFFDITTEDGLVVKGFKLIEGINGLFMSMPSEKKEDGEYEYTCYFPKEKKNLFDELFEMAKTEYKKEDSNQKENNEDTNQSDEVPF